MKKLVIISNQNSVSSAPYSRIVNYAKAISANSVHVYIAPNDSNLDHFDKLFENIYISTFSIEKSFFCKVTKSLLRCFNTFFFINRLRTLFKDEKESAVFLLFSTDMWLAIWTIILLKGSGKNKIFYEKNERVLGFFKNYNFIYSFFKYNLLKVFLVDNFLPRFFDGIIVISTQFEIFYNKKKIKTLRIPVLTDIDDDYGSTSMQKSGIFNIGYFGSIAYYICGFDLFFKVLAVIDQQDVVININLFGKVGKNDHKYFEKYLQVYNLESKVHFHQAVPNNIVSKKMREQHLLILLRPRTLQSTFGFSTKIAEYMATGAPVLASSVGDNSIYIKDGKNGFLFEPSDYNSLEAKLNFIIQTRYNIKDIGQEGKKTAYHNFYYMNYSQILFDYLFA